MTRSLLLGLILSAALGIVLSDSAPAAAQNRGPGPGINPANKPAFSPYLNLNRRGTDPALNYYGLVRPELAANSAIQQLQQQQNYLAGQQEALSQAASGLSQTGHPTGYMTHGRYFLNNR